MINAWSLLHEEYYGTMAKTYPIKENDMSPCKLENIKITSLESDEYDPIVTVGSGNTASASPPYFVDTTDWENISIDTTNCPVTLTGLSTDQLYATPPYVEDPICSVNMDDLIFADPDGGINTPKGYKCADEGVLNIDSGYDLSFDEYPLAQNFLADNDDAVAHHFSTAADPATAVQHGELPPTGIKDPSTRKYKEDESIEALKNYISTTYGGHYTSDTNDVQTLDLIESVGDAESFCRSNAIKYLSRYDKKGQAKRDILKALHYSLLLYHFSGQLKETTTRGYETF